MHCLWMVVDELINNYSCKLRRHRILYVPEFGNFLKNENIVALNLKQRIETDIVKGEKSGNDSSLIYLAQRIHN